MSIDAVSTQPVSGRVSKPGDQGHHQTDSVSAQIVLVNGGRHSAREPEEWCALVQRRYRSRRFAALRTPSSDRCLATLTVAGRLRRAGSVNSGQNRQHGSRV